MPFLLFGILFIKIASVITLENSSVSIISVGLSERKPFTYLNENGIPKGLDVLIMDNFAKEFNFQLEFIIINSSLNYIFTNKENSDAFLSQKFSR